MRRRKTMIVLLLALTVGSGVSLSGEFEPLAFDASFAVRTIAALTEAYIGGLGESMRALASTAELRGADWEGMRDLLCAFEDSMLPYDAWFLLPDGSYYKPDSGLQSGNLSDRGYFARVMAGEATIGDLVHSRSTGRKSMVLTVPIEQGEAVVGALGVTLYLEEFCLLLADRLRLPMEVGFYASNADRVLALHSDPSRLLEPESEAGIATAQGGIHVSSQLEWVFFLGTTED